jgi:hypothetical protein
MNSNAKIQRKQKAATIADELFTIQTEIDNVQLKLNSINKDKLKTLSLTELSHFRDKLQRVQIYIRDLNSSIKKIESA